MNNKLLELVDELGRQCERFLSTYSRESKIRAVRIGARPVHRAVLDIIALTSVHEFDVVALKSIHPFGMKVLEIAHFPAGSGKGAAITQSVENPRALLHIGVFEDGGLVSVLTSPTAPFRMAGRSRFVTLEDLATVGISAYDLVEHTHRLAHEVYVEMSITQKGCLS